MRIAHAFDLSASSLDDIIDDIHDNALPTALEQTSVGVLTSLSAATSTSSDDVNFQTDDIDDTLLIAASQSIENASGIFVLMALPVAAAVTSSDDVNFHTDDIDDALLIAASQSIEFDFNIALRHIGSHGPFQYLNSIVYKVVLIKTS